MDFFKKLIFQDDSFHFYFIDEDMIQLTLEVYLLLCFLKLWPFNVCIMDTHKSRNPKMFM